MSRSSYGFGESEYQYFMTWTIVGWLPLFTRDEAVQIIFDSWKYLHQHENFTLLGYVILENHLHLIASAPKISDAVRRSKSYTARRIIDLLERRNTQTLLRQLKAHTLRHKQESGSEYQVWQEGSHPMQIDHTEMMWQKLEYTHMNPVRRGYIDDPLHWRYSSARNYAKQPGLIDVTTDWQ